MRRLIPAMALIGLIAGPAYAQQATGTPAGCGCPVVSAPAPVAAAPIRRRTYRRPSPPAPSTDASITPLPPVTINADYPSRPATRVVAEPIAGLGVFLGSGQPGPFGPNGTGLADSGISDGVMGGSAGAGGPGPNSIGW